MPTVSWAAGTSGNWSTGADWSGGSVPNATDDVVISTQSPETITFNGPADTIFSLTVNDGTLQITASSLRVLGNTSVRGALIESGPATTLTLGGASSVLSGQVTQTAGTIEVASGTLELTAAGNALGGTLGGDAVDFAAGSETFGKAFKLTTATVAVVNATLTLGAALTYAGSWTQSGGAVALAGKKLTLSGAVSFNTGSIDGPGTVLMTKTATIADINLVGAVTLQNKGQMSLGFTILSSNNAGVPTLVNLQGATLTETASIDAAAGTVVENQGSLLLSGPEFPVQLEVALINTGRVEVGSSGATFAGVTGAGTIAVDRGAAANFAAASVAAGETVALGSFAALTAAPLSTSGAGFAATIAGFAAGNIIEAIGFQASVTALSFDSVHDVLTLTEGGTVGKLQFAGSYTAADFQMLSHVGTVVIGHS